jgi:predicted nuclease with TOPRIM domain
VQNFINKDGSKFKFQKKMDQKSDQWIKDALLSTERMQRDMNEIREECRSIDVKIEELKKERTLLENKWSDIKERKNMIVNTIESMWKVKDMFQPK